jgi:mono/diheme cytochrome c family protein
MSGKLFGVCVTAASAATFTVNAVSAERLDIGKREYEANCVVCHGAKGKGDGPFNDSLKVRAPDLTVLSKTNDGLFPVNRVLEVIDGRNQVKGHGTREMPIWGDVYNVQAAPQFDDYPYNAALFVWARTLALIDYLNRLQVK